MDDMQYMAGVKVAQANSEITLLFMSCDCHYV